MVSMAVYLFFRSTITLLKPLDVFVWIFFVVAFLAVPLVSRTLAKKELRLERDSSYWTSYGKTAWYAFGCLMGETFDVGKEEKMDTAWGIRLVVVAILDMNPQLKKKLFHLQGGLTGPGAFSASS